MTGELNLWAFLAIGLVPSVTSIVVALIQYNKGKSNLDLKVEHLEGRFDELKVELKRDIECVEKKVDENIKDTGKIKGKIVGLEKDVEMLKGKGVKYAN
jgi:low affinity Fe/Cu permease